MNANPQFLAPKFTADAAHVDAAAIKPLPNSRKVYVQGSRPDLLVPFGELNDLMGIKRIKEMEKSFLTRTTT